MELVINFKGFSKITEEMEETPTTSDT